MLRFEVFNHPDTFTQLRSRWSELGELSDVATPFQTAEWQSRWYDHFGRRREPRILTAWEGRDLVGVFSTLRSHGPWRSLRSLGVGPSDYLHPLVHREYPTVSADLLRLAQDQPDVDLVDLHQLPASQLPTPDQGEITPQAACLRIDLPTSFDAYVAGLSKSLRADVRRGMRAVDSGDLSIEIATENNSGEALEILFDLHWRRWKSRGLPGAFLGRIPGFQREWVRTASQNGWLRLMVLREHGVPIGALYGMAFHRTTFFYQAGFEPTAGKISPGTVLVAAAVRQAIKEGCSTFDLMRGDEPYKRRWRPTQEETNYRLLLPKEGPRAAIASSLVRTGARLEDQIRVRLEGREATGQR